MHKSSHIQLEFHIHKLIKVGMLQIAEIPFRGGQVHYNKQAPNPYDRDIVPGTYEGGFKVWQCTLDLLKFLSDSSIDLAGKRVLDLGCGHGLLGIAALKAGASMCVFQDYNKQVLTGITQSNVVINDIEAGRCQYVFGDWDSVDLQHKFDFILGAEIIYKQENYSKIVSLVKRLLAPEGIALFANKSYYFGVGGNVDDFQDVVGANGFVYETALKIVPEKGGNKKQISIIRFNTQML